MSIGLRRLRTWFGLCSLGAALWVSACSGKKDMDADASGGTDSGGSTSAGGVTNKGGVTGKGGATAEGGETTGGTLTSGGAVSEAGAGAAPAEGGAGGVLGVGGAPELGDGSGLPNAPAGSWTYLVYMLADNNLEPFGLDDMKELMSVGSGGNVTILAEIDRAVGESSAPIGGLPNFTSTKRVRVDAGKLTELEDLGEQNLGSAQTFQAFLEWGLTASPSEHYAVILWDHGGAWPRYGADDSAQGDGLTLPELTRGIDAAAKSTGLLGPIDVLGFDACLMGTWEVAASFA
ncbi:MAG TPA: clostripain-related cysteine peptidase, partial [Polyangiaceae bacterium]|nr:clostripain-related cysteine peptidase [Polyangiaceae bacterium]